MEKGVNLTPGERQLIETIRAIDIEFGRIPLVIYVQHRKLIRVEMEKFIESKTFTT